MRFDCIHCRKATTKPQSVKGAFLRMLTLLQIIKPETKPYSVVTDPTYLSGKKFIFTGGTVDYEDNSIECNLIELN